MKPEYALLTFTALPAAYAASQAAEGSSRCGEAYYHPSEYTCYDSDFLCPVVQSTPTQRCGPDCYLPSIYSCDNGVLGPPRESPPDNTSLCTQAPTTQWLSAPPYENFFYSDCHSASQVVVTSPLSTSNLTLIGPRLLVAWPAGNSGAVAFFEPADGVNGSLAIRLENGTSDSQPLHGVFEPPTMDSLSVMPMVGVSSLFHLNASAVLTIPILGSVRNIRDFTEGPSLLHPAIQDGIKVEETEGGGVVLSRLWLDNMTSTRVSFQPTELSRKISIDNGTLKMEAGSYSFTAKFDYPRLDQLASTKVLNPQSQDLISGQSERITALAFLSYSQKLLAGAWRFLTYFGRDSMITALLLQPILSEGEGGAMEAVISAVLERLNRTSGIVCHEETIGDYATFTHLQNNISSTSPDCTYFMIDTDYYLAPLMAKYFLNTELGRQRTTDFLATSATLDFGNRGLTYGELALTNAEGIMNRTAAFAQENGQTQANLIHLTSGEIVGQWRDSTYGLGGGRIPYDVNTALVPAALRAIAALAQAGWYPSHPEWAETAAQSAQIWEDETLRFFEVVVPREEAISLVQNYTESTGAGFPSHSDEISSEVVFHAVALEGNNNQSIVRVMNTDDCFRLFLLNTTHQSQLTSFLNQTATNIRAPFPVGLLTPLSLVVANPAYGNDPLYAANFSTNAYHGTVVWSWQLAMMAAGLHRQLARCTITDADDAAAIPTFCHDPAVHANVVAAYHALWDSLDANAAVLESEVWSWVYRDGDFVLESLGALPPPVGSSPTESNVRQLWSLAFIAVRRDESIR